MTGSAIKAAYEVAKQVHSGSLGQGIGAKKLQAEEGFNVNSARDFIMVFRHMIRGESFQRGLSASDTDYFLTRIGADFGLVALRTAVQALWLHIHYYENIRRVTMHKLRAVAAHNQAKAATSGTLQEHEALFSAALSQSAADSSEKRKARLKVASKVPGRTPVVLFVFERNPDVVAEVLHRANGICEHCGKPAPFLRRRDGSAYLEVHHRVQLANGGEDTVENATALCPNCHRELHYGPTRGR